MTLQQLRYFCAVVEHKFNISNAARTLHTSQPGISKQIGLLETELGVYLLVRRGNRLVGVTEPGQTALMISKRILRDSQNLRLLGDEFTKELSGKLIVAATHVHARYWLPPVIVAFKKKYPHVQLELLRAAPLNVIQMVSSGEAHLGICTRPEPISDDLIALACHKLERCVLCPPGHPLLRKKKLTLEDIAKYPLVLQTATYTGGWEIKRALEKKGIKPNIVLSVADAEIAKVCVEQGLGITVFPSRVIDRKRDRLIRTIDASHLFEPIKSHVVLHQNYYLRGYASDFICMFAPQWGRNAIQEAMAATTSSGGNRHRAIRTPPSSR